MTIEPGSAETIFSTISPLGCTPPYHRILHRRSGIRVLALSWRLRDHRMQSRICSIWAYIRLLFLSWRNSSRSPTMISSVDSMFRLPHRPFAVYGAGLVLQDHGLAISKIGHSGKPRKASGFWSDPQAGKKIVAGIFSLTRWSIRRLSYPSPEVPQASSVIAMTLSSVSSRVLTPGTFSDHESDPPDCTISFDLKGCHCQI